MTDFFYPKLQNVEALEPGHLRTSWSTGEVLDVDVQWAGQPDIVMKFKPDHWMPGRVAPTVRVKLASLLLGATARITLAPLLPGFPFFAGINLSLLELPTLDFSLM